MKNSKPLTIEQLKERKGNKVFVKGLEDVWGIVKKDRVETEHFVYFFKNFNGIDKFYDFELK